MPLAHSSRIGGYGNQTPDLLHGRPEYVPLHHQPTDMSATDVKAKEQNNHDTIVPRNNGQIREQPSGLIPLKSYLMLIMSWDSE